MAHKNPPIGDAIPFTELPNEITQDLDIASPPDIIHQLNKCHSQIFEGFQDNSAKLDNDGIAEGHYSLVGEFMLDQVQKVVKAVKDLLASSSYGSTNAIVFSGCGTSGRFAFLAAKQMQHLLKGRPEEPRVRVFHTCAGGDRAIVQSVEAPEDDWNAGLDVLQEMQDDVDVERVVYVGVSCGLSAPYVAGQLHFCAEHRQKFFPVVIGFNPICLARDQEIASSGTPPNTFRSVLLKVQELMLEGKAVVINPVIGPEPITGSTRMKGGSATKMILDAIVLASFVDECSDVRKTFSVFSQGLSDLQDNHNYTTSLAQAIDMAGTALRNNGGRIIYLGDSNTAGVLGLIDASECMPTFGTPFDAVRGFVHGGHVGIGLNDKDFRRESSSAPEPDVSLHYFCTAVVPCLKSNDMLVLVGNVISNLVKFSQLQQCITSDAQIIHIKLQNEHIIPPSYSHKVLQIPLNDPSDMDVDTSPLIIESVRELALKWTLNTISTGAHVLAGKVYKNLMIDVRVSNVKLYHRAVNLVRDVAGVDANVAERALLRTIYGEDWVESNEGTGKEVDVRDHVKHACDLDLVVPKAVVLARTDITGAEAEEYLKKFPILRNAVQEILQSNVPISGNV